jgi:hypothetical protein
VYAIIDETSEEYDANNNPIINLGNVRRGVNHMAEGGTEETIAARVKVQLTTAEWEMIRAAVKNMAAIPSTQEGKCCWDTIMPCIDKRSSWKRRKAK